MVESMVESVYIDNRVDIGCTYTLFDPYSTHPKVSIINKFAFNYNR